MTTQAAPDLSQLWQGAVQDYERTTGRSLQLGQFRSMEDVMGGTEDLSNKFKGFRDDKSKVSKIRTAFKNNMWLIQAIVNTVQTVGNAASVSS
jgi:fungal STAND N-terminal Goodbye domain